MPHFAAGVIRFQEEVFPKKQALFQKTKSWASARGVVYNLL